jgi:hypothetical protein
MTMNPKADLGKELLIVSVLLFISNGLWFGLDYLWPLSFNRPHSFHNLYLGAEFVMAVTIAAVGILVRRSALRKLSLADFIVVLSCASVPVLCLFRMYKQIHFSS